MSAARLREAATLLRERAEVATPGEWNLVDFNDGEGHGRPLWGVANGEFFNPSPDEDKPWLAIELHVGIKGDAEYIATMSPPVALALADLLDEHYYRHEPECTVDDSCYEFRIADLILGTKP